MRAIAGLSLAALLLACDGGSTTTEVSVSELRLTYLGSETEDPGTDPGCPHHYAPAQMSVTRAGGRRRGSSRGSAPATTDQCCRKESARSRKRVASKRSWMRRYCWPTRCQRAR